MYVIVLIVLRFSLRRYVAVVIIPLKIHVPRGDAAEVKIIYGYAQEMAYPVT